jgi:tetrahydromethanopterin S-methyltransferase subunit E
VLLSGIGQWQVICTKRDDTYKTCDKCFFFTKLWATNREQYLTHIYKVIIIIIITIIIIIIIINNNNRIIKQNNDKIIKKFVYNNGSILKKLF